MKHVSKEHRKLLKAVAENRSAYPDFDIDRLASENGYDVHTVRNLFWQFRHNFIVNVH